MTLNRRYDCRLRAGKRRPVVQYSGGHRLSKCKEGKEAVAGMTFNPADHQLQQHQDGGRPPRRRCGLSAMSYEFYQHHNLPSTSVADQESVSKLLTFYGADDFKSGPTNSSKGQPSIEAKKRRWPLRWTVDCPRLRRTPGRSGAAGRRPFIGARLPTCPLTALSAAEPCRRILILDAGASRPHPSPRGGPPFDQNRTVFT